MGGEPAEPADARRPRARATRGARLAEREREVLALVAQGLPTAAIAARLGIAASTVDAHVAAAMRKTAAGTRLQAAVLAAGPATSRPRLEAEEMAILERLAEGRRIGDIARELGFSRRTVERRLRAARAHLGVATNAAAVVAVVTGSWSPQAEGGASGSESRCAGGKQRSLPSSP